MKIILVIQMKIIRFKKAIIHNKTSKQNLEEEIRSFRNLN